MTEQRLENCNTKGIGGPALRHMSANEEYTFLAAAKRGDSIAFEILCKQSASTVLHMARRIVRTKEDAEDVMQESFQQAFIHLKSFSGDSRFSTWLSRIAINAALMKLRKRHFREVSLDESAETGQASHLELVDQGLNPEQLYARVERQRILSRAMLELTPGMRRAIELRELDERSSEEAAQIMGISVSAVKARVFHGRIKLRERLKGLVGLACASGRETSRAVDHTRHISGSQTACSAGN
jgi:RNA polymerase sigma-70 factor, ECF subfamily